MWVHRSAFDVACLREVFPLLPGYIAATYIPLWGRGMPDLKEKSNSCYSLALLYSDLHGIGGENTLILPVFGLLLNKDYLQTLWSLDSWSKLSPREATSSSRKGSRVKAFVSWSRFLQLYSTSKTNLPGVTSWQDLSLCGQAFHIQHGVGLYFPSRGRVLPVITIF